MMTSLRYANKVVLITGGSSGIGKGCAQEFVKAGAEVVICSNREDEGARVATSLQDVAKEQGAGGASFVYCDVTKSADIHNLIETAVLKHGRLDCLINNA